MKTPVAIIAVIAAATLAAAAPPVFTTKSFEDAKAQSIKDHKLLIVDSMADWCGPCKMMDKTTWVDDKVVRWVGDNAIALQFDVDKDKALAEQFKIEAMPTVIILKDGREFDRSVGYQKPAQLLAWLDAVQRGQTSLDLARKAAGDRMDKDGKVDVRARLSLARKLAQGGKTAEALDEYAWLWDNMVKFEPAMGGVRVSFMASDMQRLAQHHKEALAKFQTMRDALEANLKAGSDPGRREDWIVLNEVVNDQPRTLAWFDRVKDDPQAASDLERSDYRLRRLLEANDRWADLAKLSKDPVADARGKVQMFKMTLTAMPQEHAKETIKVEADNLREELSHLYAGLLAAGKEDDADKVAAVLTEILDDAPSRRALVETALKAKQPRDRQMKLLDEADAKPIAGASQPSHLRDELTAALKDLTKGR